MPTPLGHGLAGAAVGWLATSRADARSRAIGPPLCAVLGMAPDLDLLTAQHRAYAHSVGAAALVLVAVMLVAGPARWRLASAAGLAWGSHVFLDWIGKDSSPPIGLMALWPFSHAYYQAPLQIFDEVSRRYWLPQEFLWHNLLAAGKELVILGPIAWGAWWFRRRRARLGEVDGGQYE